jgi:hypothetical protein
MNQQNYMELIPKLAGNMSQESLNEKFKFNDLAIKVFSFYKMNNNQCSIAIKSIELALKLSNHSTILRLMLIDIFIDNCRFDLVEKLHKLENAQSMYVEKLNQKLIKAKLIKH